MKMFSRNKKKKELDPNELLPFCMRCHNVGIIANEEQNHCHMCGSGGTCIPMKRSDVHYLQEHLDIRIENAIKYGRKLERESNEWG